MVRPYSLLDSKNLQISYTTLKILLHVSPPTLDNETGFDTFKSECKAHCGQIH